MGSLMSGWDAPVAKFQRNKSYTRGEIEAFWRSQKEKEDGCTSSDSSPRHSVQEVEQTPPVRKYQRSSSMPLPSRRNNLMEEKPTGTVEKDVQSTCWWTRSNWAFLNEQQIMETEESQYKHAPKNCGTFFYNPKFGTHLQIIT